MSKIYKTVMGIVFGALILSTGIVNAADTNPVINAEQPLVLMVNSSRAIIGSTMYLIDNTNVDVIAIVKDGRTLIPARFVAEKFGAKIVFNERTNTVKISNETTKAIISIGSKEMFVNDKKVMLDVPAEIQNGRTLLPLRSLAENIFAQKIYYNNGLIAIGKSEEDLVPFKTEETANKYIDFLITSNKAGYYQMQNPNKDDLIAVMDTSMGTIKIKLFPKEAPKTVENFVQLSKKGYYNGLPFHRVIKDFMVQGGDPKGDGTGGESIYGKPFEDEISDKLINLRGALSMANAGPNTNGSQFFMVQSPKMSAEIIQQMIQSNLSEEYICLYQKYSGTPWLDGKHTVFGQIFEGYQILDTIANVDKNANDKPLKDIKIKSIKIMNF